MSVREYVGARYVPLFAEPLAWDSTKNYEPLTIVLHEGNSYTSRQYVPVGIAITNEDFWALTGNYNAQIEAYRVEARQAKATADEAYEAVESLEGELGSAAYKNFTTAVEESQALPTSSAVKARIDFLTGEIKNIAVVVSQNGDGDYTNLTDAFNSYQDGDDVRILLKEGVYDEIINADLKYNSVVIVGDNTERCKIVNRSGVYKNCPMRISGNFYIKNVSFEMTLDNVGSWVPTYNSDDVLNTYPGYAIHIDSASREYDEPAFGLLENCHFYSEAFPAVGMGTNNKQTVEFINCTMVRNSSDVVYHQNMYEGAFLCHASNTVASGQNLILRNNVLSSNYGYAAHVRGDLPGGSTFKLTAVGNIFHSDDATYNGNIRYSKSSSVLDSLSTGNTGRALNAFPSKQIIFASVGINQGSEYDFSASIPGWANAFILETFAFYGGSAVDYWHKQDIAMLDSVDGGSSISMTDGENVMATQFKINTSTNKVHIEKVFKSDGLPAYNTALVIYAVRIDGINFG
jgi:hypothetical protein